MESEESLPLSSFCDKLGVSTSTAWRAIQKLINQGVVVREGAGRSSRYCLIDTYRQSVRVPLSLDSWDIEEAINRPQAARPAVGYKQAFLDDYEPNVTRYLPHPTTDRLSQIGRMGSTKPDEDENQIERLLIDIAFGSSKLEGISSTYFDTKGLILRGEAANSDSDRNEVTMILNHKSAIQFVLENRDDASSYMPIGFNLPTVSQMHTLLMTDLHPDDDEIGRPRLREVGIEGSSYQPPNIPTEISENLRTVLDKCGQISDPFEQSFFALVHLAYLQPFGDGNKRTSRMMANIPLLKANLCPISFVATPRQAYTTGLLGVYEMNRVEMLRDVYVSSYEQTAYHIHQDRNRQVAPTKLGLTHRQQIFQLVGDIIRNALDNDNLGAVKQTIAEYNDIDSQQKRDLLHIILEKSRKVTAFSARHPSYNISDSEFQAWDKRRPFYFNTETMPSQIQHRFGTNST